jgi:protoporphyrin/coproporphyrin ferrochelatase
MPADNLRVLYSAHGLPESIVAKGDPYVAQCQRTAAAIDAHLPKSFRTKLCYQSRVGPAKWVGPSTDECILEVAKSKAPVLVCPIAFVSEHVETLVDLDIETAALAKQNGVPLYLRAPALGVRDALISGLADLVEGSLKAPCGIAAGAGEAPCKASHKLCPRQNPALVSA